MSESESEGSRYEPSDGEGLSDGDGVRHSSGNIENLEPSAHTDSVVEFWRKFTIKDAVDAFLKAWASITKANVRHAWRRVAPFFSEGVREGVNLSGTITIFRRSSTSSCDLWWMALLIIGECWFFCIVI